MWLKELCCAVTYPIYRFSSAVSQIKSAFAPAKGKRKNLGKDKYTWRDSYNDKTTADYQAKIL
jgi:hypothetical protein